MPDEANDIADFQMATPLEVLTLDFVSFPYLEYWILGHHALVDIRSLRELRVAHFHDAQIIDKLLFTVGGSLEHFHLKPGAWNGKSLSRWFVFPGCFDHSRMFFLVHLRS